MNKYRNIKCTAFGFKFDSKAERNRYLVLREMGKQHEISNLILQPKFILQEKFTHRGIKHRAITYTADFQYIENCLVIVEDVKSPATVKKADYIIRKKLFIRQNPDIIV